MAVGDSSGLPELYHEEAAVAKLRLEVNGDTNSISYPTFSNATSRFLQLLNEIARAVAVKGEGRVTWYVSGLSSDGSLSVELFSKLKPPKGATHKIRDFAPDIANSFVAGFENIELHGVSPPYLSQNGIERLQGLLDLLHSNGAKGFTATAIDSKRSVRVSDKASETLNELLPTKHREIGSVEGRLETVTIRKSRKFIIYHSITKKGVTCYIEDDEVFETAQANLGSRVAVFGDVSFNAKAEPVSIQVDRVRILADSASLPRAADLTGSDPDFTGDLSTDEYLRSIRSG